ncbi:MAG: hypothetical protein EOR58_17150 [Mesorhizobium sp.]|uniref:hypothetical protein n=1 Tax=Mesorhizobium sp. TaxID=1871066 RepID=UPI000FE9F29C|nr:hypothetical protein [Mesorhizobium sp.]RWL26423.1 MAG: hypothetical protein EOR58_17150 [Mesorhizobium sp.]
MRLLGAFGLSLLAMNGVAHGSSIVVLGVSTSTPSVVRLDAIDPARLSAVSTPSMIALGDPVPAVTDEKVAAIPEKSGHQPAPMIIRGGVVGGAFATPAATAPAKPATPATAATTPANGTSTATPPNGKAGSQPTATANASGGAQPQVQPKNAQPLPRVGKAM